MDLSRGAGVDQLADQTWTHGSVHDKGQTHHECVLTRTMNKDIIHMVPNQRSMQAI
jgi:hypothetical protein